MRQSFTNLFDSGYVGGRRRIFCTGVVSFTMCVALTTTQSYAVGIHRPEKSIEALGKELSTKHFKYAAQVIGKVIDVQGQSLPGVTVVLKGTTVGATTDVDGNYTINVPDGQENGILVFSYIGFADKEVPIGNQSTINVQLQEDTKKLNEVVVVGYGTQKREEITSAVSNVSEEEFNQSGARNAMDLVQGKVAGLTVDRSSSNPNTGVALQIRGITSITGGQAPLVVIDGIPGGNLDLLQQDDIASISVLKDGSAAAIYGTRANGGVILVTTKRGKSGAPRFDYNTYFRKEYVRNRPDFMNADEYRAIIAQGLIDASYDYGSTTDAYDELINHDNLSQNHNLALSGGSATTTYRASIYYQDLQGIAKENSRKQYGGRFSLNQTGLQDRLTAQINLATNFNRANRLGGGGWEGSLVRNPTLPFYNPDGSFLFEPTSTNEVARLEQETNRRQQQTSSFDAKLNLEILRGLQASIFGAMQRNSYEDGAYRQLNSEFSLENDIFRGGGYARRGTYLRTDYTVEPTIQFDEIIANDHHINAVGGYSYQYTVEENFFAENYGFVNDIFEENNLGAGNQLQEGKANMGSGKGDNTLIAFFGRVNYSFQEKYLLSLILRHEGSSRFGENNKWGNFPAASVGWNIYKEPFMENIAFINSLKIRAGYGVTGNQDIANYSSLVTLGTGGVYINPDGEYRQTYGPNRNPNPDLRWEKKKELNVGIDFSILNDKLSGSIDVFRRKTEDLLYNYTSQLPPFVRETIYTNVGAISNKGVEITLSAIPVQTEDFTWNVDVTGSHATNEADNLSNDLYKTDVISEGAIGGFGALGDAFRIVEGGKIGNFYGKRFASFDENGDWLFYNRNGDAVPFDQINNSNDPEVTDLAVIGNAIPKYYASMTNDFRYKNLGLRVFLRGRFGYDILNTMDLSYGNQVALPNNILKSAFTRNAQLTDTYQYSDYYLESGNFVKLDEITLSYNFNFNTPFIRNLRIYATGSNLATFTKYNGNDPDYVLTTGIGNEINGRRLGIDVRDPYPNTRSFLIGLNVGF